MFRLYLLLLLLFGTPISLFSQNKEEESILKVDSDTIATDKYVIFRNHLVLYADFGTVSSPFFIRFKDTLGNPHTLNYRMNHGLLMGIGGSYKSLMLRLGFMLVNNLENKSKYGKTNYLGIHFAFPIKNTFTELSLIYYGGYALINADKKIPEYPNKTIIYPKISTINISASTYYFFNRNFSFNPVLGRSGNYKSKVTSWYLKGIFGYNDVNDKESSIIPEYFHKIVTNRVKASRIGAVEFAVIPGFAYVNRYKNWQFSGVAGIGVSIQQKYYHLTNHTRNSMGLAPRVDMKINLGYNPEDWFVMLNAELSYKQIRFYNLLYSNPIVGIKLTGGYRFKLKEKDKKSA